MKNFFIGMGLLGFIFTTWAESISAQELSKHSTVAVSKEKLTDGRLKFVFKVIPSDKMVINMDGPWKLDIRKSDGIDLKSAKLLKSEMQENVPGFTTESKSPPAAKSGKLDYHLTAFVCSKDKAQCFRDVHKETFSW